MSSIQDIENEIRDLKQQERDLCEKATSDLKAKINEKKELLQQAILEKQRAHLEQYRTIAKLIAEMSEMSFLMFQISGFDNEFKVTNHVRWLEFQDEKPDTYKNWSNYASDEGPLIDSVMRVYLKIKEQYLNHVGEEFVSEFIL